MEITNTKQIELTPEEVREAIIDHLIAKGINAAGSRVDFSGEYFDGATVTITEKEKPQ